MPTRIEMGAAAWREPALAVALTTATIAGLVVVGGRVYTAAVLHNGPTLKLRDTRQHSRAPHPARHGDATEPAELADTTTVRSEEMSVERNRRVKTVAFALAAALALAAVTVALSGDVIVGVAVGAATYAMIDRITKAWGGPSEASTKDHPSDSVTKPTATHNT